MRSQHDDLNTSGAGATGAPARREFPATLPIGYVDAEGAIHRDVVLRKMTGKEEAILADRRFQRNGGKLVTELLHSCITRIGDLSPNGRSTVANMYSADRNYLLLRLRYAGVDPSQPMLNMLVRNDPNVAAGYPMTIETALANRPFTPWAIRSRGGLWHRGRPQGGHVCRPWGNLPAAH